MGKGSTGRHLPAFILLFLAKENMHGLKLVNQMNAEMPSMKADGPAVYRALSELEKQGAVVACWLTEQPGAAKKCYAITDQGRALLAVYSKDIEERKRNLEFFLEAVKAYL